mgnify:CR=1 FL=1
MKKIDLYYDAECPICKQYSMYLNISKKYIFNILNARDHMSKIEWFRMKGFEINDGMIVTIDDERILQGAEAINTISITKSKLLDFLISRTSTQKLIIFLYPLIKIIRLLLLKILNKNETI